LFIAGRPEKGPQVWNLQTGEAVRELPTLATRETKLAYSADASTLAAGGRDKTVRILDVSSGRERVKITGGLGGIEAFAFSPDGAALVAADNDTNIRVWSTRNGELLRLIEELPVTTFSLAFSPDGKYLASGGVDRILYLWDARTWKLLRKIPGQPEMIARVAFSPDSRLVVTGGFNDISSREPVTILVRDVESGEVLQRMPSSHAVSAAAFSPDGRLIVTTNRDAIDLWRVSPRGQR
jgi:WD40 repeat protein